MTHVAGGGGGGGGGVVLFASSGRIPHENQYMNHP